MYRKAMPETKSAWINAYKTPIRRESVGLIRPPKGLTKWDIVTFICALWSKHIYLRPLHSLQYPIHSQFTNGNSFWIILVINIFVENTYGRSYIFYFENEQLRYREVVCLPERQNSLVTKHWLTYWKENQMQLICLGMIVVCPIYARSGLRIEIYHVECRSALSTVPYRISIRRSLYSAPISWNLVFPQLVSHSHNRSEILQYSHILCKSSERGNGRYGGKKSHEIWVWDEFWTASLCCTTRALAVESATGLWPAGTRSSFPMLSLFPPPRQVLERSPDVLFALPHIFPLCICLVL